MERREKKGKNGEKNKTALCKYSKLERFITQIHFHQFSLAPLKKSFYLFD